MKIVACTEEFAQDILFILNDAIIHSTALYDYRPRPVESMQKWFETKRSGNFPVIGMVNEDGKLMGFGTYGSFRAWPAYQYSVEHSLYVHPDHRGKGIGKVLLAEIIKAAEVQQYHCLIAGIDSSNAISINLHKKSGFQHCGTIRQVGYKFSNWLDLEFYQLLLKGPEKPEEG